MAVGERRPLAEARKVAERFGEALAPFCVRIELAGSIRRCREDVGDIEIVAIPRFRLVQGPPPDLFRPAPVLEVSMVWEAIEAMGTGVCEPIKVKKTPSETFIESLGQDREVLGNRTKGEEMKKPLLELMSHYLSFCLDRGLSAKTVRAYRIDLTQFASCSAGGIPTREDLVAFKVCIRPLAPASRKRKLASLSAFCHWLEDEDEVAAPIFKRRDFSVRIPGVLPRNLTPNAVEELLSGLKSYGALVVRLLLFTGLRVSELCSLNVGDYGRENGCFRVMGKGSRERTIPVADRPTLERLNRYLDRRAPRASDALLVNRNGERLRPDSVRKIIRRAAPDVTPHMLRHTCATMFVEAGMNPRHLQRLLGHSTITTTEKYIHLTEVSLQEEVRKHRLPIGRSKNETQPRKLQHNKFVTELFEQRERHISYLLKLGAKDPEEILQEVAISLAAKAPPESVAPLAAIRKRLKWAFLNSLRGEKALKRGGGKRVSLTAVEAQI